MLRCTCVVIATLQCGQDKSKALKKSEQRDRLLLSTTHFFARLTGIPDLVLQLVFNGLPAWALATLPRVRVDAYA